MFLAPVGDGYFVVPLTVRPLNGDVEIRSPQGARCVERLLFTSVLSYQRALVVGKVNSPHARPHSLRSNVTIRSFVISFALFVVKSFQTKQVGQAAAFQSFFFVAPCGYFHEELSGHTSDGFCPPTMNAPPISGSSFTASIARLCQGRAGSFMVICSSSITGAISVCTKNRVFASKSSAVKPRILSLRSAA
jgi:hypothetical protein